nr:WecB/TagA/CpsF family glycosyltransferase [Deltaproteobacteria bacterium]
MSDDTIIILGIPVDNLDMDETVDHIFEMIEAFKADGRSRQVATVNLDFVVNTLTWGLKHIRHPELLDILRRADLVTADGMPIVWTSKLLGTPLTGRVTGADLVPRLAEEAAKHGKSIYFLGGRGDVGKKAAELLRNRYPNLRVAGTDAPFVHTEGAALSGAEEEDQAIIERINRSGADILLIGFGNPKQEIWFDRNINRLKVPVSIGIGGTYEFITGSVARAPVWMQETGLEWIFRITQDPKRLWKRYFVGFLKFGLMVLPAILYHKYRRLLFDLYYRAGMVPDVHTHPADNSEIASVGVITLPISLDAAAVMRIKENIEKKAGQYSNTILDFNRVDFIDSSGLGMLVTLWRKTKENRRKLFMIKINSTIRRFFVLNRVIDLFKDRIFDDLNETLSHIKEMSTLPSFYCLEVIRAEDVIFNFFGTL